MVKNFYIDEIAEIIPLEKEIETIDISVSGDNLFFANKILTHNSGFSSSDPGMEDTGESFGLPAALDLFIAVLSNEELEKLKQQIWKQVKNRYRNKTKNTKFIMGVDIDKQRLYDVEDQHGADAEAKPVFDNSATADKLFEKKKFLDKNIFDDFK